MSFWEKKIVIPSTPVPGINNDQSLTGHCERFSAYPEKRQHAACFGLELKNFQ